MNIKNTIEALLFYKGEPMTLKKIVSLLGVSEEEVVVSLNELETTLTGGIRLMRNGDEVMLATSPETSSFIEKIIKEELSRDLGKAGLETLSIILYMGPITRSRIDYIRGVNSTFIIRNLMVRGLVEKIPNPHDQRSFLYKPTFELLSYLGIPRIEELPDFDTVTQEIKSFEKTHQENTETPKEEDYQEENENE